MSGATVLLLAVYAGLQVPAAVGPTRAAASVHVDASQGPAGYTIERSWRERWLYERQRPAFAAFDTADAWVRVDSVVPGAPPAGAAGERAHRAGRTVYLSDVRSIARAQLVLDGSGRLVRDSAWLKPIDAAQARALTTLRSDMPPYVSLPRVRLWDLVLPFHPARLRRGESWRDPVEAAATDGWVSRELRGQRTSVLEGDTSVGGRRLWRVRHSARVRYFETARVRERTMDTLATEVRQGTGDIHGSYLYDPELGLALTADDTTMLVGSAALLYPDGRVFRTPARYDGTRHTVLLDAGATVVRARERREASQRESGGMVMYPRTPAEQRLAAGEPAAVDSAVAAWRREPDPGRKARLFRSLLVWSDRAAATQGTLLAAVLAAGDTADVVNQLSRRLWATPLDTFALRVLLPFMADPGLAFASGVARDPLYENLGSQLLREPPAFSADTARWPCHPAACRLLAAQWPRAREPRLRALGLVVRVALEPARWADTVLAASTRPAPSPVDRSVAGFLRPAADALAGKRTTIPASAAPPPVPGPGADWRAWSAWLGQRRLDGTDASLLRLQQSAHGRDVPAELRAGLSGAGDDSARTVFRRILLDIGELRLDPGEVERHLRSTDAAERELGRRELPPLFSGTQPADAATAETVLDRLLATRVEGAPGWPTLEGARRPERPLRPGGLSSVPVFVLADSLPPALRERWRTRLTPITRAAWVERPYRDAAILLRPSRVQRVGPFLRARLDWEQRYARSAEQAPAGDAGGIDLYLLETAEGLVIVLEGGWVT